MKKILITTFLILISCKTSEINKSNCKENMDFKKAFFYHIKYIENNIGISQDSTFMKSIIFISNHAPVSVNQIMNYARSYPIGVFQQDYIKWIQWYEEDKCTNIQFKNKYVIPEVYKEAYGSDYLYLSNLNTK
ncbi:hypothetical protein [Flavobacterium sp. 316]|uniref:hypothetical protein n=1 Tax=Flavobacterium sp. 316 TaxID=1603293 RepID=UPI000AAB0498|nr:hypothetical protein [Flavobacterium sp. 316]